MLGTGSIELRDFAASELRDVGTSELSETHARGGRLTILVIRRELAAGAPHQELRLYRAVSHWV